MKTVTQEKPKKFENNTGQISHALKQESENNTTKKSKHFIPLLVILSNDYPFFVEMYCIIKTFLSTLVIQLVVVVVPFCSI